MLMALHGPLSTTRNVFLGMCEPKSLTQQSSEFVIIGAFSRFAWLGEHGTGRASRALPQLEFGLLLSLLLLPEGCRPGVTEFQLVRGDRYELECWPALQLKSALLGVSGLRSLKCRLRGKSLLSYRSIAMV
jgi:hypothetical protein